MNGKTGPEIRSQRVRKLVYDTLEQIKTEIDESGGVYPNGKLTLVEIRKRAGVSHATINRMTEPRIFLKEYNDSFNSMNTDRSRPKPAHLAKIKQQKLALSMLEAEIICLKQKLEEKDKRIKQLEKYADNLNKKPPQA